MSEMNILYIDDEEDLVSLASSFFEEEGIPIDSCTNFEVALTKIRSKKYDLIISDSRMPSGTGRQLVETIRREGIFDGKFMLLTGNLDFKLEEEKSLYDMVIYKPLRFMELIDKVKSMLSIKV